MSVIINGVGGGGKNGTVLTANTTYYVSPSGDDVHGDGSITRPWATPQHAANFISQTLDLAGWTVFVNCAANPAPGYGNVFMNGFFSSAAAQGGVSTAVVFVGDNTTPSNVWANRWVLSGPNVTVYISGFHIAANAAGAFLSSVRALANINSAQQSQNNAGTIQIGHPSILNKMEFDASDSWFTLEGNIGFSGCDATLNCTVNSPDGFYFGATGSTGFFEGSTLTITGAPTWGTAFVRQDINSYSEWFLGFSGTAHGQRFLCQAGGETFGDGTTEYLPGDTPGRTGSMGIYVDGNLARLSNAESPSIAGITAIQDSHVNYQQPTTGFNITVANTQGNVTLDPAGTLATGTVTMSAHALDGQLLTIKTSQAITAFTLAPGAGQSVVNAPTTLSAGQQVNLIYKGSNSTWYAASAGGGGTPGGTSGQIQYNNAGAFGGFGYWNGSVTVSFGNLATAQQLLVYNTVDTISGPTNYERGTFDWTTSANLLTVGTQSGGTGTLRDMNLRSANWVYGTPQATVFGGAGSTTGVGFGILTANGQTYYMGQDGNPGNMYYTSNTRPGSQIGDENQPAWVITQGYSNDSFRIFRAPANGVGGALTFHLLLRLDSTPVLTLNNDAGIAAVAAALLEVNNGLLAGFAQLRLNANTVANLPVASGQYLGARATVSDATQTLTAGIGTVVAGTGGNVVPVFCDGTNWRIG